jgi:hypothetical protein
MWLSFSKMFSPACAFLRKSIITKIKQRFSIQQMIEMDAFPKVFILIVHQFLGYILKYSKLV